MSNIPEDVRRKIKAEAERRGKKNEYKEDHQYWRGWVNGHIAGGEFGYNLAQQEIEQLSQWKKEAMEVFPDMQAIAKVLKIKLGESIHDKILPAIKLQQKEIERLKEVCEQIEQQRREWADMCIKKQKRIEELIMGLRDLRY